ncbi:MAG TPA: S41 family peptidase [Acidobacteriota bacterium]|nr:S41 family peptidase [Acidobacteriota bacterium]
MKTLAQTPPKSFVKLDITQPAPTNLDFEADSKSSVPTGWGSPTAGFGYQVQLDESQHKTGKYSALLKFDPTTSSRGNTFGNLMQAVDGVPFRGKRIKFRAAVRVRSEDTYGRAQLWLRVDRTTKLPGFFDNMQDRPILAQDWNYFEIVADIDDDAEVLNFGVIVLDRTSVWLDDVSITELGALALHKEPARPLTEQGLRNVTTFSRVLGYVRYFHPADQAAQIDWDDFAVQGIRKIESAKDSKALIHQLTDLFSPIAPTVQIYQTGNKPPLPAELKFPLPGTVPEHVVTWYHRGCRVKKGGDSNGVYESTRAYHPIVQGQLPKEVAAPDQPFVADLGNGISVSIPISVFATGKKTLPLKAPGASQPIVLERFTGDDRATRLADIALAWNTFQHFYPYFDVVKTDWPAVLPESLKEAAIAPDGQAFLLTLQRMVAQLQDGHGFVSQGGLSQGALPFQWDWAENRLVVTEVAASIADKIKRGDVVESVNGLSTEKAIFEKETLISGATPQWKRFIALQQLRSGKIKTEVKLDLRRADNSTYQITLPFGVPPEGLEETRPPKLHELKPGIFYIDVERITDDDFQQALPQLIQAKGVIFDFRGYPNCSPMVIQHLTKTPIESARFMVPLVSTPDHQNMINFDQAGRWNLPPLSPYISAKKVFLTDGRAISYAESCMGIIEAYKLGEIVGTATAGTNGNVNPFRLPGDYRISWTGMKVVKHDGSPHHGVGIKPTIRLERTIQGIREGRDEQLDKAVELLKAE